ncbi:hypothetical protein [Proteus vulgaris]|nr:hypothetical protein [Proteus vulgaris]
MMMKFSLSDEHEEDNDKNNIAKVCINAMKFCIKNNLFQKPESTIYLFMLSDGYGEEELLNWNKDLNIQAIQKELLKWINEEL